MWNRIKHFWHQEQGASAIFVALSLIPMLGFVGLTVDGSRAFLVRDALQKSLDAAGLAAGHALDQDDAIPDAEMFFAQNFEQLAPFAEVSEFTIEQNAGGTKITLSAQASVFLSFMRVLGYESVQISASTEITRVTRGMELVLAMDVTGSMRSGGKITVMKDAAASLVDTVYGNDEDGNPNDEAPNLWVGLVPYAVTVNVGPQHSDWLSMASEGFVSGNAYFPSSWKGCVMGRANPDDETDDVPADVPFEAYYYADEVDNNWIVEDLDDLEQPGDAALVETHAGINYLLKEADTYQNDSKGPNLGCGPPVTPLVASRATVQAGVAEMEPWHRGGTMGNQGLVWAWRALSPNWRGLWGGDSPDSLPLDYGTAFMDKVVVVLTDGKNQVYDWNQPLTPGSNDGPQGSDYGAYGRLNDFGYTSKTAARQEIDQRFASVCEAMKTEGIIIYSITFGPSPDDDAQELFANCATQPDFYFHAPTNDELQDVFDTIGRQLSNLRISG